MGSDLTVTDTRDGVICLLTISGDMDMINAPRLLMRLAGVVDDRVERLVLDLSGLTFLDCAGARALETVIGSASAACPVTVRSVSTSAQHLLRVLGVDLAPAPTVSALGIRRARRLTEQAKTSRQFAGELITQSLRVAEGMAAAQENVAVTLALMAAQRPRDADRLTAMSDTARRNAVLRRDWVDRYAQSHPVL